MQPRIHLEEKPDIYLLHVQVYVPMYCGLHFLFRRIHYHSCNALYSTSQMHCKIRRGEGFPVDWRESVICPIFKKGEKNRAENYRGITLLNTGYKLYVSVLSGRIKREIEEKEVVPDSQAGFRGTEYCKQCVHPGRFSKERIEEERGRMVSLFVDFRAAFDKVSWIRKRDLHILTAGILTYTSDQRFQVIRPDKSDNWTLQIKFPQLRDSGVYECQVNTEPKMSLPFRLNVIEAKARILEASDLHVKAGSSVTLTCVINQGPHDLGTVFWYKGTEIVQTLQPHVNDADSVTRVTVQRIEIRRSCRPVAWTTSSDPTIRIHSIQNTLHIATEMGWCPVMFEPLIYEKNQWNIFK
ncbi:hypothetical protein GEV33_004653 [Tenebrio molitor]|uniref:Ig-like domain-containing protein n=1 Tax=Tenebrio molitor TaxID=7067 RepID=A0A8J6LG62_TENMO|nr:hypothetical protein GEV33_004653 [Tenebrio molitor]